MVIGMVAEWKGTCFEFPVSIIWRIKARLRSREKKRKIRNYEQLKLSELLGRCIKVMKITIGGGDAKGAKANLGLTAMGNHAFCWDVNLQGIKS